MKTRSHTGWRSVAIALALAAVPMATTAQTSAPSSADVELRRQVTARFAVVPLKNGLALSGATSDRRVEIDNGVVMAGGVPLSGDELRRRLGADAALVVRLSYLDNAALRRLFAPPPAAPAVPVLPNGPPAPAASSAPAATAAPAAPPAAPVPPPPVIFDRPSPAEAERVYRRTGARLALGQSIVIAEDEDVTESVIAVGGSVRVDGRVRDELVVIGGSLELTPTAEVRGDITVVGGQVTIAPGARHTGELHHGMARGFPGWAWPTVRWSWIDLGGAARWLSLAGTLTRVALLGLAVALLTVVARGRVTRIGAVAAATPVRAGLIGLATQVLFIPALVVLALVMAVTIVGLPLVAIVMPLAVVLMCAAMVLGFTSLAHRLGQAIWRRAGWATETAVWAGVLGMAVIVLPTILARLVGMAPESARAITMALLVVGTAMEYVAWTIGLGAAVMTGLGTWAIVPPPLPPAVIVDAPSAL